MHEEIEYAEMLEIPVSTINVVKKSNRRKKQKTTENKPAHHPLATPINEQSFQANPLKDSTPLKDSVIAQVNDKLSDTENLPMENVAFNNENDYSNPTEITAEADLFAESVNSDGRLDFDPIPERIDTVRLYSEENKRSFWDRFRFKDREFSLYPHDVELSENEMMTEEEDDTPKWLKYTLNGEFIAACALCATIFLTNVFMPGSAINTFFRSINGGNTAATDTRSYADFQLTPVISELSNAELNLSPTGILSFTEEGCVYPAANGTISAIEQQTDGTYRVKISHSDSFTGVIGGLDYVYYAIGEDVKANVPVGYSDGEAEVQVTMYSNGLLLNCFELTEENCLAWVEQN
jgi:hypothetical protein